MHVGCVDNVRLSSGQIAQGIKHFQKVNFRCHNSNFSREMSYGKISIMSKSFVSIPLTFLRIKKGNLEVYLFAFHQKYQFIQVEPGLEQ